MQQIKGAILKSRLAFVEQHAGKDGVERVLRSLPPADQRTLRMVFTSNWYPFALGTALDDAIVREIGAGVGCAGRASPARTRFHPDEAAR